MSTLARIGPRVVPHRAAGWWLWAATGAAGIAAPAVLETLAGSRGPVCAMQAVLHVCCPTCGLTRALVLLVHGELGSSLALHPWAVAVAVQLVAAWLVGGAWLMGAMKQRPDRWLPRVVAWNALALIAIWLVRLATGTLPPLG